MRHRKKTPREPGRGKPPDRRDLDRWLRAEASGREAEAEAALATLMRGVDRLEPAAGFADRVLAGLAPQQPQPIAARRTETARPSRWRWPLDVRGSVVAALAALVICWLMTPVLGVWVVGPATESLSMAELLESAGRGLDWAAQGLARVGEVWSLFSGLAQALATAAGTLPIATVLLVGLGIAGLALRALSDLIARERSWSHVHYGG